MEYFCFAVYDVVTGKIVSKLKGHVSFSRNSSDLMQINLILTTVYHLR